MTEEEKKLLKDLYSDKARYEMIEAGELFEMVVYDGEEMTVQDNLYAYFIKEKWWILKGIRICQTYQ